MNEFTENKKYQDIIKTAKSLLSKYGIKRVTIEEICREAKVSKMTFYRFFSNKTELTKMVLKNLFDNGLKEYQQLMESNLPFEEKIKQQILMKFDKTNELGSELIKDIFNNRELGLIDYWEKRKNEVFQIVLKDYAYAQKKGWMRKDIKLEFIIYMVNKMYEMVSDEKLADLYDNIQDLIMELTKFYFYGLLPHKSKAED